MNGHRLHARARLFAGPGLGHSTAHPCSVNSVHSERNWQHVTSPQVAPEEENGQSAPSVLRGRGEAQGVTAGIRKRSRGKPTPTLARFQRLSIIVIPWALHSLCHQHLSSHLRYLHPSFGFVSPNRGDSILRSQPDGLLGVHIKARQRRKAFLEWRCAFAGSWRQVF